MGSLLVPSWIPAVFYRGGTSNAVMVNRAHLPVDEAEWVPIFAGALGSPDPYGHQLNGLGGGISSLSKVCVIEKSQVDGADVNYTFVQVGVSDGKADTAGTCGNMTAAVGPYAVDEGLVEPEVQLDGGERIATVSIFNTNTNKIFHASFAVEGGKARFKSKGDYSIDGVPGTGSRITLSFVSPGGSKTGKTLPTGNPVDVLYIAATNSREALTINASLIDVANPAVIVLASDAGIKGDVTPDQLDKDQATMDLLEDIRKAGAKLMGLPNVASIPKIAIISAPQPSIDAVDIVARVLSMEKTHKAIPLTIALNVGVASNILGTLPNSLAKAKGGTTGRDSVVVGHPSGTLQVGAEMRDGEVKSGVLHRTARPLMRGEVYWR